MSIRQSAIPWLKSKNVSAKEAIYTSKFYRAEESWPKKEVWWLQIPLRAIQQNKAIHLLCQTAPDGNDFYYFKVPSAFFQDNLNLLDKVNDIVHLYFSADSLDLFVEIRGKGRLKFKQFLISGN